MLNNVGNFLSVMAMVETRHGRAMAEDYQDLIAVEQDRFWQDNQLKMPRHPGDWHALGIGAGLNLEQAKQLNRFQILNFVKSHPGGASSAPRSSDHQPEPSRGPSTSADVPLADLIMQAFKRQSLRKEMALFILSHDRCSIEHLAEDVYSDGECETQRIESIKKTQQRINKRMRDIDPRVQIFLEGGRLRWVDDRRPAEGL